MGAALIYDPAMAGYRFPPPHPMRPERFTAAVDLMTERGLLQPPNELVRPSPASDDDIALVHDRALIAAVRAASPDAAPDTGYSHGIGPGDTPAFAHMHEAAALVAGGTLTGLLHVLETDTPHAFNPAGGMHHAHRDRVAGFCVYNDCAIAIARVTAERPGLHVAYVDIDAHHGDGVEEAFRERDDVLTLSVHESGQYLYPGTGSHRETGSGAGDGFTLNVPLPPYAGDECYARVLNEVITPALHAFAPDVLVLQAGADTHRDDPLTHLDLTIDGYTSLVAGITTLAEAVCGGRLLATGGGGYEYRFAVPRMFSNAFSVLCGVEPPKMEEPSPAPDSETLDRARDLTDRMIADLREGHPLLRSGVF